MTNLCNIKHMDSYCLALRLSETHDINTMSLVDCGDHSFLPPSVFYNHTQNINESLIALTCSASSSQPSWTDLKIVIDKVQKTFVDTHLIMISSSSYTTTASGMINVRSMYLMLWIPVQIVILSKPQLVHAGCLLVLCHAASTMSCLLITFFQKTSIFFI